MPKLDIVYNAHSGAFRKERLNALVQAFERHGFAVTALETIANGVQISGSADLICVHGGDGTLRDTIHALGRRAGEIPLCVARSGTINLVARELDYPTNPDALAEKVARGWKRGPAGWVHSPLYLLGDTPIASCLSLGPDSQAVAHVSGRLKKRIGRFAYVVAMLRVLRNWPRRSMNLRGELATGEIFACQAEAIIVSRGAFYAGPYRLSPKAALVADSVELITLQRSTRLRMLGFALVAMLGLPVDRFGFAEIRSVRSVNGECRDVPVQVDGDHLTGSNFAIRPSGQTIRYVV